MHLRFPAPSPRPESSERQVMLDIDERDRFALVAEIGGEIVGVGRWISTELQRVPKVAFLVEDAHQGLGIGSALVLRLAIAAARQGHRELAASVLSENRHMVTVFEHSGLSIIKTLSGTVWDLTIDLSSAVSARSESA